MVRIALHCVKRGVNANLDLHFDHDNVVDLGQMRSFDMIIMRIIKF